MGLSCDDCLDDYVLDLAFELAHLGPADFLAFLMNNIIVHRSKTSFVAFSAPVILVVLKHLLIELINRIICEMHILISHVAWVWSLIRCRCKSTKTIFKQVNSKRVNTD